MIDESANYKDQLKVIVEKHRQLPNHLGHERVSLDRINGCISRWRKDIKPRNIYFIVFNVMMDHLEILQLDP